MCFSRLYIPTMLEKAPDFDVAEHMTSCGLIADAQNVDDAKNEYHNVKDFKWHNVLQKSPNWTTLSDEETREFLLRSKGLEDESSYSPDILPTEPNQSNEVANAVQDGNVIDDEDEL